MKSSLLMVRELPPSPSPSPLRSFLAMAPGKLRAVLLPLLVALAMVFLVLLHGFSPLFPQSPPMAIRCNTMRNKRLRLLFPQHLPPPPLNSSFLTRIHFPRAFVFGTASSAFQYEGASKIDGRGASIWDTFSEDRGNILNGANADVSCDQYHLYKEDIQLMRDMGVDAYRFSISWPRLFPNGTGMVNPKGVAYYNNLINGLLEAGIKPYVTLYHWDLPQALQDAYGGWLSEYIINDFVAYAETCFRLFGDRVKHWITFNEPNIFIQMGYDVGIFAPRRCSSWIRNCSNGNSATEPYIAAHNVLLSHAAAVDVFRTRFQHKGTTIGISISVNWYIPLQNTTEDAAAAQRILDFQLGWFLDPLMHGDYPSVMRKLVGNRLPLFTAEQMEKLKHSIDFIGINHYTTQYVSAMNQTWDINHTDFYQDSLTSLTSERDGIPIGPKAASEWLYIVPTGIYHVIKYINETYHLPIYITENGMDDDGSLPMEQSLEDWNRVQFHKDYLFNVAQAIWEGANVRGYFAWSLLDNFEWAVGYTSRFGLYYVDYASLKRYPKASSKWFKAFLTTGPVRVEKTKHRRWWLPGCLPP